MLILLAPQNSPGQVPIPRIIEKDGRYELLVNGKPFFMLGGTPLPLKLITKSIIQ